MSDLLGLDSPYSYPQEGLSFSISRVLNSSSDDSNQFFEVAVQTGVELDGSA